MGIQEELKDAIDEGRDELVGVLAAHRVLPVVVEGSEEGSDLLGRSKMPDFSFERQYESDTEHVADRQTRRLVIDTLGLTSAEECEDLQEEIRTHDEWGARA